MAPPVRPKRRSEFGGRKFTPRRKVCRFCADKIPVVDYKDLGRLRSFLSERAKIEPRRKTGTCAPHQRSLNVALKRARHLALLPYTAEHIRITGVVMRDPSAGPRGPRGPRPLTDAAETPDGVVAEAPQSAEGVESPVDGAAPTPAEAAPPVENAAPAPAEPVSEADAAPEKAAAPASA